MRTNHFGDTGQYFAVVYLNRIGIESQLGKNTANHEDNLGFTEQAICAHYVCITLVKLPVAPLLWTICTPNRLDLVPLKGKRKLVAVHGYVARKWYRKVITQAFFRYFGEDCTSTKC